MVEGGADDGFLVHVQPAAGTQQTRIVVFLELPLFACVSVAGSRYLAAQVRKDAALIASGALTSVEWVFTKSPITGLSGPTKGLKNLLNDNNIPWSEK
ncbi:hypothetical protein CVS27_20035 [Arthrobacter glacialis]|uniref:Uncharacterized protein n=1 Tax=Arthrobacter glacialis TaxID=1664 RepID=A0A2S3ZQU9_ARTGL|nr:hypothetical protein CVS27_20035 [Arthrobacter glacialis]